MYVHTVSGFQEIFENNLHTPIFASFSALHYVRVKTNEENCSASFVSDAHLVKSDFVSFRSSGKVSCHQPRTQRTILSHILPNLEEWLSRFAQYVVDLKTTKTFSESNESDLESCFQIIPHVKILSACQHNLFKVVELNAKR